MNSYRKLGSIGLGLALTAGAAWAADPILPSPVSEMPIFVQTPTPTPPPVPPTPAPRVTPIPPTPPTPPVPNAQRPPTQGANDFAAAAPQTDGFGERTGGEQLSLNPFMMGDLSSQGFIIRPSPNPSPSPSQPSSRSSGSRIPIVTRGAFKIGENESPFPVDRFYVTYDFFYNLNTSFGPTAPRQNLHREVFGYEKTFFDGDASIGIRVPYLQPEGGLLAPTCIGDLSFILKGLLVGSNQTGNGISAGLMVTAPTCDGVPETITGDSIHSTLLTPFLGYRWFPGNLLVQGFSSVLVPTDSRDVTVFFNDISLGYRVNLGEDRFLKAIIPTSEVHVSTALNNNASNVDPIGFSDCVVLTEGAHMFFGQSSVLTVGVAFPITGPRPFDMQALVQWNYRF